MRGMFCVSRPSKSAHFISFFLCSTVCWFSCEIWNCTPNVGKIGLMSTPCACMCACINVYVCYYVTQFLFYRSTHICTPKHMRNELLINTQLSHFSYHKNSVQNLNVNIGNNSKEGKEKSIPFSVYGARESHNIIRKCLLASVQVNSATATTANSNLR